MGERGEGAVGYGEVFADVYDEWYGELDDVEAMVEAIAGLVGGGAAERRVLELGVGTGRLAIPLAERGVSLAERGVCLAERGAQGDERRAFTVEGVDNSAAMLERLRANDTRQLVRATRCDMSKALPAGSFEVIFAAYNTFFNLLTEQAQRACVALAARRLSPTGSLVIEAFVPRADLLTNCELQAGEGHTSGEVVGVGGPTVGEGHANEAQRAGRRVNRVVRFGRDQRIDGEIVVLGDDARQDEMPDVRPWSIRYVTPDQLDVMARAVGLELAERRATWRGEPFTADSAAHVSRYIKPPRPARPQH